MESERSRRFRKHRMAAEVLLMLLPLAAQCRFTAVTAWWSPPPPPFSAVRRQPPRRTGLDHGAWSGKPGAARRVGAAGAPSSLDHSGEGISAAITAHNDTAAVAADDDTAFSILGTGRDLWDEIRARFQGDFDNYDQVLDDRNEGRFPREGGGHEHIHCTLVPLSDATRLAAFYFDGSPRSIFRFRYYELVPKLDSDGDGDSGASLEAVDTVLYTLHPELEQQLRAQAESPSAWPELFEQFRPSAATDINSDRARILPRCDVRWSWRRDPVLHGYVTRDGGIHAAMVHGEAIVDSQVAPGQKLRILDQLSLYPDVLYIHDRGFDAATGEYVYGNRRNVPYRLERVSEFRGLGAQREVVSDRLRWTLGPAHRTEADFRDKLAAMGGPSNPRVR